MIRKAPLFAVIPLLTFLFASCSDSSDPATPVGSGASLHESTTRECDDAAWLGLASNTDEWLWGV